MYSPIIIPTLNRYEHLVRCIESLKKNPLACETELYISIDYPPTEKYVAGYERVKNYIENELQDGFKNIYKFYQKKNLGPLGNVFFLRDEVFKTYDRYIFTEDDNEFSPNFLEYINKGLDLFERDERIFSICGYRNEKPWQCDDGNVMKLSIFHAWGYATWKDKIEKCHQWICRDNFTKLLHDKNFCNRLYRERYKSYYTFIQSLLANPTDSNSVYIDSKGDIQEFDYTIAIYMIAFGMHSVLPSITKVRNWGYDGSGAHCGRIEEMNLAEVVIDNEQSFEFIIPGAFGENEINKKLNRDDEYKKLAQKAKFFRVLMCVAGIPIARKINNALYLVGSSTRKVFGCLRKDK